MNEPRKVSRMRRWLFGSVLATGAVLALFAAAAFWLLGTASGAQFALQRVLELADGRVGAVEGRLVGPLTIGVVEISAPELRLRAARVSVDWSPLRLLGGEVRVKHLHAAALDVATAAMGEPARAPSTLVLPLRVFVEQAGVNRLRVATIGEEEGGVALQDVSLKLAADQTAWILGGAEATTPVGRAKVSGTLGARTPFRLDMNGELEGTRNGATYRTTVEAKGSLAKIEAVFAGRYSGLSGTGTSSLEPFSATPLRTLTVKLDGIDLAQFAATPHTKLAIDAELAPAGAALLAGPVRIVNADAGPLDRKRLPVTSLVARLAIAKERVEAKGLVMSFAGGGGAEGEAVWSGGKLDAKLALKDGDLLAWHSSLKATRLAGDISAVATQEAQSFRLKLADPRFDISGEARIAQGRLTVERVRLGRAAAFAEARAMLEFGGAREFSVQGRIERLDPADFAEVPAGDINAVFDVKGSLAEPVAGAAVLDLAKSRFAGLAAMGRVSLAAQGDRLSTTGTDLSLGTARIRANGALGRAADALEIRLASPDLAPIGRAFGVALGGRIDLDVKVTGVFAALSGRASVDARDLVLPGAIRVAAVAGHLELGAGDNGAANAEVVMRGLARSADKTATIERASLAIKGVRSRHEIRIETSFADNASARALLDGGVAMGERLPEWRGRLESVDFTGRASMALAAPASLIVSAERMELGEAFFAGDPGAMRLSATRWTPSLLESRGTASAIDIRAIQRALGQRGLLGSNLVLKGDWDVRVGESVDGSVSVERVRGDVRVGEPRLALGLETLAFRAQASGGRATASVELLGKQAGQWKGEASATLRRGENGWEVSPGAPVEGRFSLDVPQLGWMAAWLGADAKAAGRLKGEGSLSGTARDPAWRGRVEATGLAIREPLLGTDVAEGTIILALAGRNVRIERFELSAPWRPLPEAARAIAAAARPSTGTITAEGAMDLGTRKGSIRVKASNFPLTSLATRFLAVSGEGQADLDALSTSMTGEFKVVAGWVGIPVTAPPSLSDDVIVDRGVEAAVADQGSERVRLDLRVDLGEHLHFRGRGLVTRLAGSLRLAGEVGPNLRAIGTIRAVGGTYDAYGRTLAIERGAINFQGPVNNPGLNVLALRKGLPVEGGVEVLGTVARPKVRLFSSPDVPDPEKLAWLVLGRGQGELSAGDATMLVGAANALFGSDMSGSKKALAGLGVDDVRMGRDDSGALGVLPQSTVAGRTGAASAAEVVTVGKRLSDDIYVSYRQGLADAEGSLRVAWQLTRRLQVIMRAGSLPGVDAVYRFTFD